MPELTERSARKWTLKHRNALKSLLKGFDYSAPLPILACCPNNVGDPFHDSNFLSNTHDMERVEDAVRLVDAFQGGVNQLGRRYSPVLSCATASLAVSSRSSVTFGTHQSLYDSRGGSRTAPVDVITAV